MPVVPLPQNNTRVATTRGNWIISRSPIRKTNTSGSSITTARRSRKKKLRFLLSRLNLARTKSREKFTLPTSRTLVPTPPSRSRSLTSLESPTAHSISSTKSYFYKLEKIFKNSLVKRRSRETQSTRSICSPLTELPTFTRFLFAIMEREPVPTGILVISSFLFLAEKRTNSSLTR